MISATVGFADVTSANIVGYTSVDSPLGGKFKALTVSFQSVGEVADVGINDLVKVSSPKGAASCLVTADQIWLWDTDAGDWAKYFYHNTKKAWCKEKTTAATTDTIRNGETFFFRRGNGGTAGVTLTLSGQVQEFVAKPEYNVPAGGKFTFIGYPWPVSMPIAGFQKYQAAPRGATSALVTADQIWRWNTTAGDWDKYFYHSTKKVWCKAKTTVETTDVLDAGEGFFFRRGNGGAVDKITFTYGE